MLCPHRPICVRRRCPHTHYRSTKRSKETRSRRELLPTATNTKELKGNLHPRLLCHYNVAHTAWATSNPYRLMSDGMTLWLHTRRIVITSGLQNNQRSQGCQNRQIVKGLIWYQRPSVSPHSHAGCPLKLHFIYAGPSAVCYTLAYNWVTCAQLWQLNTMWKNIHVELHGHVRLGNWGKLRGILNPRHLEALKQSLS